VATGRFISYLRVSTARQGKSGLGLEAQRAAVSEYLNGGRWKLIEEVVEVESGERSDRPALARALATCRLHNATLVIAKLDRLARNVAFIANLMEAGVDFVAADLPQANRLTVHILAAIAEHEAVAISTRTKAALARAKARGTKLGGDRGNLPRVAKAGSKASVVARREKAQARARDLGVVVADLRRHGHTSLRELAAGLNEREISAPRGGQWQAQQVARVLRQMDDAAISHRTAQHHQTR
jgi:DNA invertase Pin-like site-specific DNA recombinase